MGNICGTRALGPHRPRGVSTRGFTRLPGRALHRDDVADIGLAACPGVQRFTSDDERFDVTLEILELRPLAAYLVELVLQDLDRVPTWRLTLVAQSDDWSDLSQGQAGGLGGTYELEPVECVGLVMSVPVGTSLGGIQNSRAFIEANGLG